MVCSRVSKTLVKRQKMLKKAFPAFPQNVVIVDVGNVASAFRNVENITDVFTRVSKTLTKIFSARVVSARIILSPAFHEMLGNFLAWKQ